MDRFDTSRWIISRGRVALAGMLLVVLVVRLLPLAGIYRGDAVILSANDPYYYRHLVLGLHETDPVGVGSVASLPPVIAHGEPLLVVTLWGLTVAAGGAWAVDTVLAWYPVITALITGIIVYQTGLAITRDQRVGLAAVGFLAVTPGNAFRTGLGFADHHAFDYLWLALTLYALVQLLLVDHDDRWSRWESVFLLTIGVVGQTLAWEASPLLLLPMAAMVPVVSMILVVDEEDWRLGHLTAGLGIAAGAVLVAHRLLGWHQPAVAAVPVLLFVGSLGVWLATAIVVRTDRSAVTLAAIHILGGVGCAAAVVGFEIGVVTLRSGAGRLFAASDIGEMISVFGGSGPVTGPLILLGFAPLFALPTMGWAARYAVRRREPAWVALIVYAVYFMGIAAVQRRFTGQVAITLAVFAGLGFVWLLAWLDLASLPRPFADGGTTADTQPTACTEEVPRGSRGSPSPAVDDIELPDRRRIVGVAIISLAYGLPGVLYTEFITRDLTIDRAAYRAARWMQAYADDHGWDYPNNFVFSHWGRNRMFNAVVNGQSESYGFAKEYYEDFLFENRPRAWFESLRNRVGFIVTRELDEERTGGRLVMTMDMYRRLHLNLGTETDSASGLAHYRAVYVSKDGTAKVFTLVPGAVLSGTTADSSVVVSTPVRIPGASFTYRQRTTVEDDEFSITVPYPGEYTVRSESQTRHVVVSDDDVRAGVHYSL